MSFAESSSLYDDLLDLLVEGADASRLGAFRLSAETQRRLDELLEKNRDGTLNEHDRGELATFEQIEHVVRLLKARLRKTDVR